MLNGLEEYINEVILHKQYVLEGAKIMSDYLISIDKYDTAVELINRCSLHDNSKFLREEMIRLLAIKDKSDFRDPTKLLTDEKKRAIRYHWANNRHHPEYFDDITKMTDLDLMEMACDCFARSLQYNTDFLSFIEIRQRERFKFPDDIYQKYYNYCCILDVNYKLSKHDDTAKVKTITFN